MTIQETLTTCARAGIRVSARGAVLDVDAPRGAMTPTLRGELIAHKPMLLEVLPRLAGMSVHTDPLPTAKSAREAPGGPGRCFSCGLPHEHPESYGRCDWCQIAVEAYYAIYGTLDDRTMPASEPARRTA